MCNPARNKPKQLQKPCLAHPALPHQGTSRQPGSSRNRFGAQAHTGNADTVHGDETTIKRIKKKKRKEKARFACCL